MKAGDVTEAADDPRIARLPRLVRELDDCLLTDAEMAGGPEAWRLLADPFGPWQQEAA